MTPSTVMMWALAVLACAVASLSVAIVVRVVVDMVRGNVRYLD